MGLKYVGVLCALSCVGTAGYADGIYGAASLGLSASKITDNGELEGVAQSREPYLALGYQWADVYAQIEGHYAFANLSPSPTEITHDGLSNGSTYGLRAGASFGAASLDVFFGQSEGYADEGSTLRRYYGISGSYNVTDWLWVNALYGVLDGEDGTDANGLDGPRKLRHGALELNYRPLDELTLSLGGLHGLGVIDATEDKFSISEIWVEASFAASDALDIYARVKQTDMYQAFENDRVIDQRVEVGVRYAFGASDTKQPMRMPAYHDWLANAAGIVE